MIIPFNKIYILYGEHGEHKTAMENCIDIHSHMIPCVDDGADSLETSRQMLTIAAEDGISHMILTPHNKPAHRNVAPRRIVERMNEGAEEADIGAADDNEGNEDAAEEDVAPDGEDRGSDEGAADDCADTLDNGNGNVAEALEIVQPTRNTGAPELVFRDTEVTIDAGTNVPWTEIISTLRDDKDDYATLYYNLQVSPYNRSKPGTYPVTVYTEDSDGNRSQTVLVTITVR